MVEFSGINPIEPASIKSILLCIDNSLRCLCAAQANVDWPFITQPRAPTADFLILENNKKVTLCIKMPYYDAIVYSVWLMMLMSLLNFPKGEVHCSQDTNV